MINFYDTYIILICFGCTKKVYTVSHICCFNAINDRIMKQTLDEILDSKYLFCIKFIHQCGLY